MAELATAIKKPEDRLVTPRQPFAFTALIAFSVLYFARPEDVLHVLAVVPLGKITGGVALLALIVELRKRRGVKMPLALKLLLLLFVQMCATIPFAYWKGGAFSMVFSSFSKAVIVAVLVSMLVTTLPQLRRLIFVQAAAVSFLTLVSVAVHNSDSGGRLSGVAGGVFENPNDLAINIAINFPFCFAFFLNARGPVRKALWAGAMVIMLYAVTITYSRSGFLALVLAVLLCLWEFGIKGRRWHLLVLAGLLMLGIAAASPRNYSERLQSIFLGRIHGSQDHGSAEARKELLETSIQIMAQHPLFGVGPGNFQVVTGGWRVAHNTYTEVGAEAGIPALILFLLVLGAGFQSLRFAQKSAMYKRDKEFQILTGALLGSFGAYLVGAFFSDTAYNLFPYFLIAYTCGLRRIVELQSARATAPVEKLELRTPSSMQSPTIARFAARPSQGIRG